MKKQYYIKPEVNVIEVKFDSSILAASIQLYNDDVEESNEEFEDGWQY